MNGQDTIAPIDRRNMIMAEDKDFSQSQPGLREIEFELLGVSQNQEGGLHPKIFQTQLRSAARNLKSILQIACKDKGSTQIPKRLLGKANLLLWDIKYRYTPASPQFLKNGAEEVISYLVFIHDRINMYLRKHAPNLIDTDSARFDLSHRHMTKPRVFQPFTRREQSGSEASRPE